MATGSEHNRTGEDNGGGLQQGQDTFRCLDDGCSHHLVLQAMRTHCIYQKDRRFFKETRGEYIGAMEAGLKYDGHRDIG